MASERIALLEVLKMASEHGVDHTPALSKWIRETLGVVFPCGWPEPEVTSTGFVELEGYGKMTPEEARGIAAAIIVAAEYAEGHRGA